MLEYDMAQGEENTVTNTTHPRERPVLTQIIGTPQTPLGHPTVGYLMLDELRWGAERPTTRAGRVWSPLWDLGSPAGEQQK